MNENLTEQNNAEQTEQPTFDGTQPPQPPTFDGTQPPQPPTFDGTQEPPTFDGTQPPQPPTFDGTQEPPTFDGTQEPPTFDGTQEPPTFDGTQPPQPPMFGQGFMPPPPNANMWGNDSFAGEEIFNSDNFSFGAPNDLSGITDIGGSDISSDFGEQQTFGNFLQDGIRPAMFGGQGGQFNQPQQTSQTQAE